MSGPSFQIAGVRSEPYAAVPTLVFRLRLERLEPALRHIGLQCTVRIEPERRRYSLAEEDKLVELFGDAPRWGQTLKPFLWTQVSQMVTPAVETDLAVPCSYDFEVAAAKYLHALEGGDVPLRFLFSGTLFVETDRGLSISQIPWDREATYRLPVAMWRELMDQYFPNAGWLRLRRETLDSLLSFKGRRALGSWDEVIESLLSHAEVR